MGGKGRWVHIQRRKSKGEGDTASQRDTVGCLVTCDISGEAVWVSCISDFCYLASSRSPWGNQNLHRSSQVEPGSRNCCCSQPSPQGGCLTSFPSLQSPWLCYHLLYLSAKEASQVVKPSGQREPSRSGMAYYSQKILRAIISSNQGCRCMCDMQLYLARLQGLTL